MQLFPGGKSRARRLQQPCFCRRYGRPTLLPKCGNKIVVTQDSSFFRQRFFQRFHHGHTGAGAVQCQRSAGGHPVRQPFLHGGHAGLGHAHQRDSAALQLPLRLDEIASVRPQRGGFPCHTQRSRRTCKTRQPRTAAPAGRQVFRHMRVAGRHIYAVCSFRFHSRTQRGDFFQNRHRPISPFLWSVSLLCPVYHLKSLCKRRLHAEKGIFFLHGKAGPEISPARLLADIRQKAMRAQPSSLAGGRPSSLRPVST